VNIAIIGAGLTGAVIAERCARNGHSFVVFEKRDHIGGNCYDYVDEETGILVSKYGPHFFHTNDDN
jgi:UDP-galactopyranose mutase